MEYFRDPKNQIYADIAYRLGRIVTQYDKISTNEEKFEATLYLTVLQNLMTTSNEYVRQMTQSARKNSIFNQDISDSIWGIDNKCWIRHTFNENPNLQNFITRLRNSVSHPTETDLKSEYPSTGYTTIKDNSGSIKKFRFINSPDTLNSRLKMYSSHDIKRLLYEQVRKNCKEKYKSEKDDTIEMIQQKIKSSACTTWKIKNEFPEDTSYKQFLNNAEKYQLISKNETFIRISIIDLSVMQLGEFVKKLANYLAQPIQENWDGETIKDLIAA
jgi:hypothetical protein